MPVNKEKFKEIRDRGSVTLIKKGSKASKLYGKEKSRIEDSYRKLDKKAGDPLKKYPATNNKINKSAASKMSAERTVGTMKFKQKKYGKGY